MNNLTDILALHDHKPCRDSAATSSAENSGNDLSGYTIYSQKTIRESFRQASFNKRGFVVAVDRSGRVLGLVSDGDFKRAIWQGVSLEQPVESIMNTSFVSFSESAYTTDDIKKVFLSTNIAQIPVLNENVLVDVIFRKDFYKNELHLARPLLQIPVVIVAGGKGTRLDPFTRILPKPLIPIGDKAVIEIIMDRFAAHGIEDFYLLLNHKEKMVRAFFEDFNSRYNISYITEQHSLGTAGALKYLEGKFDGPFLVSNCDIIIDTDYAEIYSFHKKGGYDLTIVGSMQHYVIPYGVCTLKSQCRLEKMIEKPQYDFLANTGLYILNPDVLSFIPPDKPFHMTDLVRSLLDKDRNVGVYPVSSELWFDVGQWEGYKKAIEKLK